MSRSDDPGITRNPPAESPALDPEDYYFEGPKLVFTAAYHLKRGYLLRLGMQALSLRPRGRPRAQSPE